MYFYISAPRIYQYPPLSAAQIQFDYNHSILPYPPFPTVHFRSQPLLQIPILSHLFIISIQIIESDLSMSMIIFTVHPVPVRTPQYPKAASVHNSKINRTPRLAILIISSQTHHLANNRLSVVKIINKPSRLPHKRKTLNASRR